MSYSHTSIGFVGNMIHYLVLFSEVMIFFCDFCTDEPAANRKCVCMHECVLLEVYMMGVAAALSSVPHEIVISGVACNMHTTVLCR